MAMQLIVEILDKAPVLASTTVFIEKATFPVTVIGLFIAFLTSAFLTWGVKCYATRRSLVDVPNERSSHEKPTARGGGLSIVVIFFSVIVWLGAVDVLSVEVVLALSGGSIVALIGWIDDHRHVPPHWRALVHFVAATWAVFWLGGMPSIVLGGVSVSLGWLGSVVALVGIVWLTNLYNFMDGIDGLAGSQGAFTGVVGGAMLWIGGSYGLAIGAWVIAASCCGFLAWNWPPAKIFMGDVGSGVLGFVFAVLAIASEQSGSVPVLIWVILLAVFIGDSTFTLFKRIIRGEQWYSAHRSHAYQKLVQRVKSHRQVTIFVLALNVLLLLPLAWVSWIYPHASLYVFLGVVLVCWILWAGLQRTPPQESRS